jgi:hypothetical protein
LATTWSSFRINDVPWLEENAGTDSTSAGLDQKPFSILFPPQDFLNKLSVTSDHVRFLKKPKKEF